MGSKPGSRMKHTKFVVSRRAEEEKPGSDLTENFGSSAVGLVAPLSLVY